MAFERIAILNRGDAASRCLRAIRELRGLEGSRLIAIALYTEPDRSAPFVRQADAALSLGAALRGPRGSVPRLAYLDHGRVLAALRATRAEALWPGWGFLAEDPDFVELLEQRGLVFIGPDSAAMRRLGDKIAAKQLAEACGVPVARWSGGAVDAGSLAAAAQRVGLPLLIKASAGGGGRGIRLVTQTSELADAFVRAGAEAAHAFGDDRLFLEALVPAGRHIEVQFAADRGGRCLALGLRDCSVQRRHQKVIEEAPPPHLDIALEPALRAAAVRLATAVGYVGVGTAEFLLGGDGQAYFLEINPRLQVEHGITELLTGLDLVQLQIRLARGESLPETPPSERGHAIEARICAEDPAADFAPAPGRIVLFDLPAGAGVRTDSGVAPGSVMPSEFDPLIAKVMAHAPSRAEALARLRCVLEECRLVLDGGATNKGLLLEMLGSAALRRGGVDVGWLDRTLPELAPARGAAEALLSAAILIYQEERGRARLNFLVEAAGGQPRSIPDPGGQTVELTHRGHAYRLQVLAIGDWSYRVALDGRECVVRLLEQEAQACQLVLGDRRAAVTFASTDAALRLEIDGRPHVVGREAGGQVRAVAPAVVIAVDVAVGDTVAAGQRLGLLESMKVEVGFYAPSPGVVRAIPVRRNERVAAGAVLMQIQPSDAGSAAAAPAGAAERVALPPWDDPLLLLFGDDGMPNLDAVARREVPDRERALDALHAAMRRVLLGYDGRPDIDARIHDVLAAPLPATAAPEFLAELAELRAAVAVFADTETLFSRQPTIEAGGAVGRSNDAWLRLYLRRTGARGAGLPERFLAALRAALGHYGIADLAPGDALDRALLRLYAAQQRRESRHRLAAALLRYLARLATAGVDLAGDESLLAALGACVVLRGTVPDGLADAAADARYAIFELPGIRRRTAAATATLEGAMAMLEAPGAPPLDGAALQRLADSPAEVFERVRRWLRDDHAPRRALALQALVRRQYMPLAPTADARAAGGADVSIVRLDYGEHGIVWAALAAREQIASAWRGLRERAALEPRPTLLELLLSSREPWSQRQLETSVDALLAGGTLPAERLCVTALQSDGSRLHATRRAGGAAGRADRLGLHPETARRIDLDRLREFDLERLGASDGLYAFHGRSRAIPGDERLFVFAEVRAALPGTDGTLHEAAFVHAFAEAVRTLRGLRSEHEQWQRLHWNRITLVVRPALTLLPATRDRLVTELLPATRHLGLEKIVVRLRLRAEDGGAERAQELAIEPTAGGRVQIDWRDPHHEPLRPATDTERRLAQARRRGLFYPYDALRLFTAVPGSRFAEFDLAATGTTPPRPVSVADRPAGGNTCGVVFGLITTPTAKHPEGMTRVLILSDPTHDFGALAAPECDRLVAALDLAAERGVPAEWLATSAGARIAMDSGTENLDATARVVRRIVGFTRAGGELNVVVAGVNVGAQSYFDALATMLLPTRGVLIMLAGSAMVLTGRLALEASGSVAGEDEAAIGGVERIMGPNGEAQYVARDLADAVEILMEHYRYTYRAPSDAAPRRHVTADPSSRSIAGSPYPADAAGGFATVGEIFDDAANPGRKRPFAMRPVMHALVDQDGGWLERWAGLAGGETAIVWDAHLGGHSVCLIGIESQNVPRLGYAAADGPEQWTAGTLFPLSSKKIARAIAAASGNRPVVVLANLSGFDGSPESMRTLQLEYGAEIARAVVEFDGPILFAVVSRYHGGAYVVFSRALNDRLHAVALEGSYASVIGGSAAATVVFAREVEARTEADPRVQALRAARRAGADPERAAALAAELERLREQVALEQHGAVARAFDAVHSVERARDVGSLDAIVTVAELRPYLIAQLSR